MSKWFTFIQWYSLSKLYRVSLHGDWVDIDLSYIQLNIYSFRTYFCSLATFYFLIAEYISVYEWFSPTLIQLCQSITRVCRGFETNRTAHQTVEQCILFRWIRVIVIVTVISNESKSHGLSWYGMWDTINDHCVSVPFDEGLLQKSCRKGHCDEGHIK